jgi:phage terminase large subunit-like protein
VPGAYFDPVRVDRVIRALMRLRHTQAKWAGRPLVPDVWQVAYVIAPIFGWVRVNDDGRVVRVIREAYVDVPRKNGKTTIASGLLLYLAFADDEPGAQVLTVAGSKDQAQNAYRPAKLLAEKSPDLRAAGVRALRDQIVRDADGSFVKVAASVGDLLHGANLSGAVVDELHVHKTPDVLDAVESGTASRDQPLVLVITTADAGGKLTVYAAKRDFVERVARGAIKSPTTYGVVFAADEDDDPFAESTWRKANPGYGISPTREFMVAEATKAKESPVNLARFLRLHLGLRTKQETKYIDLGAWDRNASMVDEARMAGREAYGGLDLASVSDLTALTWVFPDDVRGGYDVLFRVWLPEMALPALDKRTAGNASAWVRNGYLRLTPGDVTDYDYIRTQVERDLEAFDVRTIGFDPWNATQLAIDLEAAGAPMVRVRQGFVTLSPPTKEVLRLILLGKPETPMLRHGGHPVARWAVDNLSVALDAAENVKPDKARAVDKIDPFAALVTAVSEAMTRTPAAVSAYATGDLTVI